MVPRHTPQNVACGIADVGAHGVRALLLVELEGLVGAPSLRGRDSFSGHGASPSIQSSVARAHHEEQGQNGRDARGHQ